MKSKNEKIKMNSRFLKTVSTAEKLIIEALDGKMHFADAQDVVKSEIIYPDLESQPAIATEETAVTIMALIKSADFEQMFTSITDNLDKIVMTQAQIIRFCEKYFSVNSRENDVAFFLMKFDCEYLVVNLSHYEHNFYASAFEFDFIPAWEANSQIFVVVPV